MDNIESHFDDMYKLFSSEDFLQRRGVSAEVPFFVCHYNAREQTKADEVAKLLQEKLDHAGVQAVLIDLYRLMIDTMKEAGDLEWTLENESTVKHDSLLADMRAQLNVRKEIAPAIADIIAKAAPRIVFVTGIGACYPIFEAHELLTNLASVIRETPLVLFFPGDYVQTPGAGASLHLFGRQQGRGYYRAFDVEIFLKMNNASK